MDPSSDPLPSKQTDLSTFPQAELVVQTGRLSGTRKVLTAPITIIGRAESCDLRLNAESIPLLHCVLALGAAGLGLRNLQPGCSTLVNGQTVTACTLHQGDQLCIGPFQFEVQLTEMARAADGFMGERQQQALRIQAAAVAAQQAALSEEEIRLQHRREALEQQEQQLATHLEEKRQRLVRLRDEAREAHAALQQVRACYEQRTAQIMADLAQSRQELADGQKQVHDERRHLLELRQRLKRRFHRHWAGERMQARRHEAALAKRKRDLEIGAERLHQEKAGLVQLRLRFNSEMELSRRNVQAEWQDLRQQQAELLQRVAVLDQREAMLVEQERQLAEQKRNWEQLRVQLQQETDSLENRVANSRRKLLDQEQERKRLQDTFDQLVRARLDQDTPAAGPEPPKDNLPVASLLPFGSRWLHKEQQLQKMEAELTSRLSALQQVAGALADQRLHLAEQYGRIALAQLQWQHGRESVATELEELEKRLRDREEALHTREQAAASTEQELRRRMEAVAEARRHQESWAARLAAHEAIWASEQNRLLASVRAREEVVKQRLAALIELGERWSKRRRRQVLRLRAQRNACEELRREQETLRREWVQRSTLLVKEQRALAERALALEQYRQQCICRAVHPKAAEKRLERFRRRWAALSVAAERALAKERKALESQAAQLEERSRRLQQFADEFTDQEAELSARQAAWEQQQLQEQAEQETRRRELHSLRKQRHAYEQQVEVLRDEVEHLARLLLDGSDPIPLPVPQAA